MSSWARRICAASCKPMLAITITSERIGHWTRMRRSLARFSGSEASVHPQSLADFITTTSAFRFSAHTRSEPSRHMRSSAGFIIATFGFKFSVHTATNVARPSRRGDRIERQFAALHESVIDPKRTSPAGVTQYHAGDIGLKLSNLRATIVELLQQVESRTLLWFDGGGVSQRKGPNHA